MNAINGRCAIMSKACSHTSYGKVVAIGSRAFATSLDAFLERGGSWFFFGV